MAPSGLREKLNHHFVPQFHFRLFSGGKPYIHVSSRDGSWLACFASIKGQCARHKYYGDQGLEDWLSKREHQYCKVYREVINIAWNGRTEILTQSEDEILREAIVVQRVRTPRHVRSISSGTDQMVLSAYYEYLKESPPSPENQAKMRAIETGKAEVKGTQFQTLMQSISDAPRTSAYISDLAPLILRNQTGKPFILGDSPCVFSNFYLRRIRDRGVLGLLSPGLMAVVPIDTPTQILLYDTAVYKPSKQNSYYDISRPSDVFTLNAQQAHAAEENVYFYDENVASYVRTFLTTQSRSLQDGNSKFVVYKPGTVLVEGEPNDGEIYHTFQSRLPVELDLSFISTLHMPGDEDPHRPRSMGLAKRVLEHRRPKNHPWVGVDTFGEHIDFHL
jgi:hypothetical protein